VRRRGLATADVAIAIPPENPASTIIRKFMSNFLATKEDGRPTDPGEAAQNKKLMAGREDDRRNSGPRDMRVHSRSFRNVFRLG